MCKSAFANSMYAGTKQRLCQLLNNVFNQWLDDYSIYMN